MAAPHCAAYLYAGMLAGPMIGLTTPIRQPKAKDLNPADAATPPVQVEKGAEAFKVDITLKGVIESSALTEGSLSPRSGVRPWVD